LPAERSPDGARDPRKLGERVAERIEDDIIRRGWPVGAVLGSESDLMQRYGVSRAVFREAMRIVDHHGVAEMRRGPGGGFVVAAPDLDAVVRTVSLQLQFQDISVEQVNEMRVALELNCVRLAIERITPEQIELLKQHLDHEVDAITHTREAGRPKGDFPSNDFHLLLAEFTGNPAMRLFVQIVMRVTGLQSPRAESLHTMAEEVHAVHRRIAEAVIAGDVEAAERRMRRHLEAVTSYIGPRRKTSRKRTA
jgi:DNA-binding FadR family transcriptional regulator